VLVFDHFFPYVQQLLTRQVGLNLHLLGLVAPHASLQAQAQLVLLYAFGLSQLLQLLLVLLGEVGPGNDCGLLSDLERHEGGVLLEEGFLEQDGLAAEHKGDGAFFDGLEDGMGDEYAVALFDFGVELGVLAVDGSAAGGNGTCALFGFVADDLIFCDNVLLLFFFFLGLAGFFGNVCRFAAAFFELKLADFEVTHALKEFSHL
jgi:hypothetical protein